MNKKNTKKLLKDFPELYKQYYWDPKDTCMCWAFCCDDGWFDLIYELSKKLKRLSPETEAVQVKEKFGGLRFYFDNTTQEGANLIQKAEKMSYNICEMCGKKGKLRNDLPWIQTLCDKHYKGDKK